MQTIRNLILEHSVYVKHVYSIYNLGNNIARHLNSPDECGKHCLSYETSL